MTDPLTSSSTSWIVESWSQGTPTSNAKQRTQRDDESGVAASGANLQAEVILRTITQLLRCNDLDEACRLLANRLQQFLGCRQVAIGWCARQRRRCRIRGLSGVVRFDSHTRFVAGIQDALEETLAHEAATEWPPGDEAGRHGALAHENLVGILGAECVASLPLRDSDDEIVGVVLFVDEPPESARELVHCYGKVMATCLALLERQQVSFVTRRVRHWRGKMSSWRGRLFCLAAACFALALIAPWPYQVSCKCLIQPVVRRFVVAPYDGTLATSQAAPGDVVRADDVLAHMDEREIRWELASLEADYARAEKERDAAMAAHRTGAAQLATLEMDGLDVKVKQLEHRIGNLAIRSPIDGVVVSGDLEKAQGAPLTIGQTLFEIAPLEKMNVELNVPEEEVSFVEPGMDVVVSLDAFPDSPLKGVLRRIHPQAELRDKESVFVAEFEMENRDGHYRPGMNGWAQITGPKRSLGWILFHKPWTAVRRAMAW